MALTTKAIIKSDWLNIASGDTSRDAMIDRMILAIEAEIKNICNQPVDATTVTREFVGNCTRVQPLYYSVPVTLTTLEYRDDPLDAWTAIAGTKVSAFVMNSLYSLFYEDVFSDPLYKATMTVGYSTIPADLQLCANEMVVELYNNTQFAGQGNRFGVSAINESEGGVSWSKAIASMRQRAIPRLRAYTRVVV